MTSFDQWWIQQNNRRLFQTHNKILTSVPPQYSNLLLKHNETGLDPQLNTSNDYIYSASILMLTIAYGIVILTGIIGNASLILTLCSSTASARLRNPLLLALCFADLLVAGLSAPLTILTLALSQRNTWTISTVGCRIINFVQSIPVAASNMCLLMLSLDRYATVKHPYLAQLRQHRYLHTTLSLCTWIVASILCYPNYFAENESMLKSEETKTFREDNGICSYKYGSLRVSSYSVIIHIFLVFLLPFIGVLLNHYGVRKKLCALSLTARAAHGELPLPMPILRRPTHMIIVTGIANANRVVDDESSDEDSPIPMVDRSLMQPTVVKMTSPISPRVMREIRAHQQRQRIGANSHQLAAAPGIPLPQTSTLRSRRRLANLLIASAIVFILCWTPHVVCVLWTEIQNKQYCSKTISYFYLLLGYLHSVINPIVYWALNHNSLRQSPCAPFIRFNVVQKFFRKRFRSTPAPPPASSTNEAALGAFNPKYIRTTEKQYKAQASSHYLY